MFTSGTRRLLSGSQSHVLSLHESDEAIDVLDCPMISVCAVVQRQTCIPTYLLTVLTVLNVHHSKVPSCKTCGIIVWFCQTKVQCSLPTMRLFGEQCGFVNHFDANRLSFPILLSSQWMNIYTSIPFILSENVMIPQSNYIPSNSKRSCMTNNHRSMPQNQLSNRQPCSKPYNEHASIDFIW